MESNTWVFCDSPDGDYPVQFCGTEKEMEKAGKEIEGLSAAPDVMSILSFDTDAVLVRVAAQCPVGEHWRIERDIRTRIKNRFDQEGIMMPHYQKPPVL